MPDKKNLDDLVLDRAGVMQATLHLTNTCGMLIALCQPCDGEDVTESVKRFARICTEISLEALGQCRRSEVARLVRKFLREGDAYLSQFLEDN